MCILCTQNGGETMTELIGPFYIVVRPDITATTITDVNTLFVSNTNYTFEVKLNRIAYRLYTFMHQIIIW